MTYDLKVLAWCGVAFLVWTGLLVPFIRLIFRQFRRLGLFVHRRMPWPSVSLRIALVAIIVSPLALRIATGAVHLPAAWQRVTLMAATIAAFFTLDTIFWTRWMAPTALWLRRAMIRFHLL